MRIIRSSIIAAVIAGAVIIGSPVAAGAAQQAAVASSADERYVSEAPVTVTPAVIAPCEQSTVTFGAGFFAPGEPVSIAVTGEHAGAAGIPSSANAAGDGSLVVTFRPPVDGNGAYAVRFAAASASYTAGITVTSGIDAAASCDHDPQVAELPLTGSTVDPILPLAAGGVLALGLAFVVTAAIRRRRSSERS